MLCHILYVIQYEVKIIHPKSEEKKLQILLPSPKYFAEKVRKSQQQKQWKNREKTEKNRENLVVLRVLKL